MTIWKFPLAIMDVQGVTMPRGARVLAVQVQGGDLCLWAMVNQEHLSERREIIICGTGNPADHAINLEFVGTVQMPPFVWHVFIGASKR